MPFQPQSLRRAIQQDCRQKLAIGTKGIEVKVSVMLYPSLLFPPSYFPPDHLFERPPNGPLGRSTVEDGLARRRSVFKACLTADEVCDGPLERENKLRGESRHFFPGVQPDGKLVLDVMDLFSSKSSPIDVMYLPITSAGPLSELSAPA